MQIPSVYKHKKKNNSIDIEENKHEEIYNDSEELYCYNRVRNLSEIKFNFKNDTLNNEEHQEMKKVIFGEDLQE